MKLGHRQEEALLLLYRQADQRVRWRAIADGGTVYPDEISHGIGGKLLRRERVESLQRLGLCWIFSGKNNGPDYVTLTPLGCREAKRRLKCNSK